MKINRNLKAFTLIELILVIVVITILFLLLIPSLDRTNHKANFVSCTSNLKQVGLATIDYMTLKGRGRYYPRYSKTEYLIAGQTHHLGNKNKQGLLFIECLFMGKRPVLREEELLRCPANPALSINKFFLDTSPTAKRPFNFDIGETSYLYRDTNNYPIYNQNSSGTPIACDRAGNHEDGYSVLFLDLHVVFAPYDGYTFGYKDNEDDESPLMDKPSNGSQYTSGTPILVE